MSKQMILRVACLLIIVLGLVPQTSCIKSLSETEVEDQIYMQVNEVRQQLGLNALSRDPDLDELARQSSETKFSDSVEQTTELRYLMHNSWWETYSLGEPRLGKGTAQKQVDYCLETTGLRELMLRSEARTTGVGIAIVGDSVYYTQVFDVLNAAGGDGEPLRLYENALAKDPTWAQLRQFVMFDNTDEQPYIPDEFVCADFAAMLHNRAEMAGMKTAYISIDFTEGPAHALNAFDTADRGVVYIDCTGQGFQEATPGGSFDTQNSNADYDKAAYVGASLEYGLIPLDKATSFDYAFYEQWDQQWAEYEEKLDLYNSGTLNFKQRQALRDELQAVQFILGDYRWEPLGIVTDVYIHW